MLPLPAPEEWAGLQCSLCPASQQQVVVIAILARNHATLHWAGHIAALADCQTLQAAARKLQHTCARTDMQAPAVTANLQATTLEEGPTILMTTGC